MTTVESAAGADAAERTEAANARDRVARGERVLSLSEAAERLRMKRSNAGKFLARRGVRPAFPKAQGYFYWLADIERVKAEREANRGQMAADARRRESALRGPVAEVERPRVPPEVAHLGAAQRVLLSELVRHPVAYPQDSRRFALLRLVRRGLAEELTGEAGRVFALTDRGRELAGWL